MDVHTTCCVHNATRIDAASLSAPVLGVILAVILPLVYLRSFAVLLGYCATPTVQFRAYTAILPFWSGWYEYEVSCDSIRCCPRHCVTTVLPPYTSARVYAARFMHLAMCFPPTLDVMRDSLHCATPYTASGVNDARCWRLASCCPPYTGHYVRPLTVLPHAPRLG